SPDHGAFSPGALRKASSSQFRRQKQQRHPRRQLPCASGPARLQSQTLSSPPPSPPSSPTSSASSSVVLGSDTDSSSGASTVWSSSVSNASDLRRGFRIVKWQNSSQTAEHDVWEEHVDPFQVDQSTDVEAVPAGKLFTAVDYVSDIVNGYIIHSVCLELLRQHFVKRGYSLSDFELVVRRHCSSRTNGILYSRFIPDRPFIGPPQGLERRAAQNQWIHDVSIKILWMLADPTKLDIHEPDRPVTVRGEGAFDFDTPLKSAELNANFVLAPIDEETGQLTFRRWIQSSCWFLNSRCLRLEPRQLPSTIFQSGARKTLVDLPMELKATIAAYLDPAGIQALEACSHAIFSARDSLWRAACLRDGFAGDPKASPTAALAALEAQKVNLKAVYFCAASRNRRRIQRVIGWLADRVEEVHAFDTSRIEAGITDKMFSASVRHAWAHLTQGMTFDPAEDDPFRSWRANIRDFVLFVEEELGITLSWRRWGMLHIEVNTIMQEIAGDDYWFNAERLFWSDCWVKGGQRLDCAVPVL
ncbi:hypothetical protein HK405_006019, partial [Cladochytrium tenue]